MKKIRVYTFLFATVMMFASGCVRYKQLVYLDNVNQGEVYKDSIIPYVIQSGDMLDISIKSPDPSRVEIFLNAGATTTNSSQSGAAMLYLKSYIVDDSGYVSVPLAGKIQVAGLSLAQIDVVVKEKLSEYLKFTTISTKLLSFRITILGEVKTPGTQFVYSPFLNIYQALGQAGDVTEMGDRSKVKIIRKQKGKNVVKMINLDGNEIMTSEYLYLHPNDIVYVMPLKVKVFRVNTSNVTFAISLLTLTLTVISLFSLGNR